MMYRRLLSKCSFKTVRHFRYYRFFGTFNGCKLGIGKVNHAEKNCQKE